MRSNTVKWKSIVMILLRSQNDNNKLGFINDKIIKFNTNTSITSNTFCNRYKTSKNWLFLFIRRTVIWVRFYLFIFENLNSTCKFWVNAYKKQPIHTESFLIHIRIKQFTGCVAVYLNILTVVTKWRIIWPFLLWG